MALALSASVMAQTGLVFSQCLTFTGTANIDVSPSNSHGRTPNYIVPDGKIWKVEFISGDLSNLSSAFLEINMIRVGELPIPQLPIWLKSGDIISLYFQSADLGYVISILEFNVN